ncbi:MAG: hypothetical protein AB9869_30915 [Verrucomicrobiia bacterium]
MKCSGKDLVTPLYLKLREDTPWPEEEQAFYLLTASGLFLCRNTPFYRSCVPVKKFPSELAEQRPFLKLRYPRIPRRLLEVTVGFFDIMGRCGSEAVVLIVWNSATRAVELVVPEQTGYVGTTSSGWVIPLELTYEIPPLPPELVLVGDIHSHVDGMAYTSSTDESDEAHRPGLHLVVGRIRQEPPHFHCEATVDEFRFKVPDLSVVVEGYHSRRIAEVPGEWVEKVTVKPWRSKWHADSDTPPQSSPNGSKPPQDSDGSASSEPFEPPASPPNP